MADLFRNDRWTAGILAFTTVSVFVGHSFRQLDTFGVAGWVVAACNALAATLIVRSIWRDRA